MLWNQDSVPLEMSWIDCDPKIVPPARSLEAALRPLTQQARVNVGDMPLRGLIQDSTMRKRRTPPN